MGLSSSKGRNRKRKGNGVTQAKENRDKNELRKLPMMPIRDMVIFPYMMPPFVVGRVMPVGVASHDPDRSPARMLEPQVARPAGEPEVVVDVPASARRQAPRARSMR